MQLMSNVRPHRKRCESTGHCKQLPERKAEVDHMAQIIQFPTPSEREWNMWEEVLRESNKNSQFDGVVLEDCLPEIKQHWESLFAPVTLTVSSPAIPGPLTQSQNLALKATLNAHVSVFGQRLKEERLNSMSRIVSLELELSYLRHHGQ
jgi:hypothetical protein